MKKYVIFVALLLITVGCSAVNNNDNKTAAPSNTNPQVDTTQPAPNNSTATTGPTANPPVAATPQPVNPPAAEPANPPVAYKPEPKPVIPPPPTGSKEVPYVTKQQVESIAMNSTYEEVSNKLGLGKLVSVTEHQAIYQYQGKNGGSAKLTFWDGKLNSKGITDLN